MLCYRDCLLKANMLGKIVIGLNFTCLYIFILDGVVTDIFLICVANLLITPLQTLLDCNYISKLLKRRKIIKMQKFSFFNQLEAN